MNQLVTKYGTLRGIAHLQYYQSGQVRQLILTEANELVTPYGVFVPQYSDDGFRRKRVKPIIFYEDGSLKNLPLQEQTVVQTSVGEVPAELITWYSNGEIKRIFPLDGSLSGFWTEEDEYDLACTLELDLPFGHLKEKLVALQFYSTRELKNITFWPQDRITVQSPMGLVEVRIGLSMYPDGPLQAIEPKVPVEVETPVGLLRAYHATAMGVHSDQLSLSFAPDGQVLELTTSTEEIQVTDQRGEVHIHRPQLQASMFSLTGKQLIPLLVSFEETQVGFSDTGAVYELKQCRFTVRKASFSNLDECGACASCTACGTGV